MKKIITSTFVLAAMQLFGQNVPNTISPADKIYGLSKFWQEANYNFVYLDKVDKNKWHERYKALIASIPNTKNDYEYYRELQKFCALLNDGHTNVYMPEGIEIFHSMFGDYRLFIQNIDGKAIVVRTNLSKKDELPVGSEIVEVNGKPTQAYLNEHVIPYLSPSTPEVLKDYATANLLDGLEGETYQLKIKKPDHKIINLSLTHKKTTEEAVYPSSEAKRPLLDFKWLGDKTAYVALNSFYDAKITQLFNEKLPELAKAKSLIIDLRNNGGGNGDFALQIIKHLTNDKVLYGAKTQTRLHMAAYKAWGAHVPEQEQNKGESQQKAYLAYHDKLYHDLPYETDKVEDGLQKIVVPTAILIGHDTASAAEDFLVYADNQKHMLKIGESTFGSTGQPFHFELPGGGSARICTKKDTYPDGRIFVGVGIVPDIEVKTNLNDFLNKKDPVLARALLYLKGK